MRFAGALLLVSAFAVAGCGKKDEKETPAGKPGEGPANNDPGTGDSPAAGLKAVQVAVGQGASCALMDDGTARCWGRKDYGELGNGKEVAEAATPVAVPGIKDGAKISMGGDPGDQGDMICVIHKSGDVSCWGYARLIPVEKAETGKVTPIPALKGATQIAHGGGTFFAAMPDGSMNAWGGGTFNAMGDGNDGYDRPITKIPGLADVTMVAGGQNHGCAMAKDGSVKCWGYTTEDKKMADVPDVKATFITAKAGGTETCAITPEKTVTCWSNGIEARPLEGLSDVTMLTGRTHWCALQSTGAVWCWGYNARGQVGNGEAGKTVNKPTQVKGITDAIHISNGPQHSCAALKSGDVKCWGYNQRGQLGDGTLMDRHSPVSVANIQAKELPAPSDGLKEVQEADMAMSWDGLPEGCQQAGTLDVAHPKHGGKFEIVSAYAESQMGGNTIRVNLANHKIDPEKLDAPRGKQLRVNLRFARINLKDKSAQPVDVGTYSMDHDKDRNVHPTMTDKASNVTWAKITLEGLDAGTATISHLDDNWICGEVDLNAGKDMTMKGKFSAKLSK